MKPTRTQLAQWRSSPNDVPSYVRPRTCGKLQFNTSATQYDWLPDYDLTALVAATSAVVGKHLIKPHAKGKLKV